MKKKIKYSTGGKNDGTYNFDHVKKYMKNKVELFNDYQ